MNSTRELHPYELTIAGDVYRGWPLTSEKLGMQAASFTFPVTRRLTVTLDLEDALAIANRLPLENLPHCGKPLHDLIDEARQHDDV